MDRDVLASAKEKLDTAIAEMLEAIGYKGLLSNWVIVGHLSELGNDEETLSRYEWLCSMDQPYHVSLGLVQILDEIVRTAPAFDEIEESDE